MTSAGVSLSPLPEDQRHTLMTQRTLPLSRGVPPPLSPAVYLSIAVLVIFAPVMATGVLPSRLPRVIGWTHSVPFFDRTPVLSGASFASGVSAGTLHSLAPAYRSVPRRLGSRSTSLPAFPQRASPRAGSIAPRPSGARRFLKNLQDSFLQSSRRMASAAQGTAASGSSTLTQDTPPQESVVVLKPTKQPTEKFRKDYKETDFLVDHVDLDFNLEKNATKVKAILTMRRRPNTRPCSLVLHGEDLSLESVEVDSAVLRETKSHDTNGTEKGVGFSATYSLDQDGFLHIPQSNLPEQADTKFLVKTSVSIDPSSNTQLMGLYVSGGLFCTQCEAEGFRRITFFLDRPDVMSMYKVRLEAEKEKNPRLLSNGNLIDSGDVPGTDGKRHFAVFEDPHLKPCYLFALVAGDMRSIVDTFETCSKKKVKVEIFSEPEDHDKLSWAMESIKKAMKWDEEKFGREYDLDVFNIVCLKDFNMGAMENKGLNIFNSALLLAHPDTTSDAEFQRIMNVIGHEYFHNWTGNRVTCRDWFQLTLKEGLTVFRDQLFTADMCSAAVKRIEDIIFLCARQFAEDSGPMAHPIRPESYIAMDNFYTATVYDKGAEVIRMYHTLLGEEGFRKGMDLYFKRHDRHAVTCDDFRAAMADSSGRDLAQFERWYLQAGTPVVTVKETQYDAQSKVFKITLGQHTPPTPRQPEKMPLHIPIKMGLLGRISKKDLLEPSTTVLELTGEEQTFEILNVAEQPVVSLLRDFSAPVKLNFTQSDDDIAFLMACDSDPVNRWQAGQKLATNIILARAKQLVATNGKHIASDANISKEVGLEALPAIFVQAFKECLLAEVPDKSIQAYTLRLPDRDSLAQEMDPIQPIALHRALLSVRRDLCDQLHEDLKVTYAKLTKPDDAKETMDAEDVARRRLRNTILGFLTVRRDEEAAELAYTHFSKAKNMTDVQAGLMALSDMTSDKREEALETFYKRAKGNPLVIDKWFMFQALADRDDVVQRVTELQKHPDFTLRNPNRLRSLIFAFGRNAAHFHSTDGKGYKLLADCVAEVDKLNPQIAARACSLLIDWKKYDPTTTGKLMKEQLQRIKELPGLSPDTLEIASKGLQDAAA